MRSLTVFVRGSTRVSRLCSVLVIQTASPPNATANDPGATGIRPMTVLVAGSMRASVPCASIMIQKLPAPTAMPPSLLPIVSGNVAVTLPDLRSIRETLLSPQVGTQTDPKPAARPEHGLAPTAMLSTILLVAGSIRVTLFLGEFEIQRCSSTAIQSGAPGMSNTASGVMLVIGSRTPGRATPGRASRACLPAAA